MHINCSPKFRKKFQLNFLGHIFFCCFQVNSQVVPHFTPSFNIFHMKALMNVREQHRVFSGFQRQMDGLKMTNLYHFQQENKFTALCQWCLPLITSFKLNSIFCRVFFSFKIWKSVTVVREHHSSLEMRWGCYLMDCQAKSAWCICSVNNIINNCMKQKVSLDSICIVVIQNRKMSHNSIFNSLEVIQP